MDIICHIVQHIAAVRTGKIPSALTQGAIFGITDDHLRLFRTLYMGYHDTCSAVFKGSKIIQIALFADTNQAIGVCDTGTLDHVEYIHLAAGFMLHIQPQAIKTNIARKLRNSGTANSNGCGKNPFTVTDLC